VHYFNNIVIHNMVPKRICTSQALFSIILHGHVCEVQMQPIAQSGTWDEAMHRHSIFPKTNHAAFNFVLLVVAPLLLPSLFSFATLQP
jgi:hypothetical protein